MAKKTNSEKKHNKVPHIYVILYSMIILGALASYIIPQGEFERTTNQSGQEVLQPGTFHFTGDSPAGITDFMTSLTEGLMESSEIMFGIIMIGGMFAVIEESGLIDIGVYKLTNLFSNKVLWVIPTIMIPLALFTSFTGQAEMMLVFIPVVLPLILKMGFDRITATAIVLIASVGGFSVALTAPANLGTAQRIAQVPLYSGIGYRAIILVVILTIGVWFVWRYAKKVLHDPTKSIVYEDEKTILDSNNEEITQHKATKRQITASIFLLLAFAVLLFGLLKFGWFFKELAGLYAIVGIVVGFIVGMSPSKIAETFHKGFLNILIGAIVVGIARGVAVVLEHGHIMDTIIYGAEKLVANVPSGITAVIMLVVQAALNFLINSGSGQAMITMPIMSGLSDLTSVSHQTSVLAFLFGDGFSNIIYPTSGAFMATLLIAKVKWEKWVRFIFPLVIIWYSLSAIFLIIAQLINY